MKELVGSVSGQRQYSPTGLLWIRKKLLQWLRELKGVCIVVLGELCKDFTIQELKALEKVALNALKEAERGNDIEGEAAMYREYLQELQLLISQKETHVV